MPCMDTSCCVSWFVQFAKPNHWPSCTMKKRCCACFLVSADDLSELLDGDEPVVLSDDDDTPFNPQKYGYTTDPWEDMEGPSKPPATSAGTTWQHFQAADAGGGEDDELCQDQHEAPRSSRRRERSSSGRGYDGIKSLTAGAADEWMPGDEGIDNPWLSCDQPDVLEEEEEHQQLLEMYTGTGAGGAAAHAGAQGRRQHENQASRSSGSEAKPLAVGGFAEEVPLHEFKYTGWPQVRVGSSEECALHCVAWENLRSPGCSGA